MNKLQPNHRVIYRCHPTASGRMSHGKAAYMRYAEHADRLVEGNAVGILHVLCVA